MPEFSIRQCFIKITKLVRTLQTELLRRQFLAIDGFSCFDGSIEVAITPNQLSVITGFWCHYIVADMVLRTSYTFWKNDDNQPVWRVTTSGHRELVSRRWSRSILQHEWRLAIEAATPTATLESFPRSRLIWRLLLLNHTACATNFYEVKVQVSVHDVKAFLIWLSNDCLKFLTLVISWFEWPCYYTICSMDPSSLWNDNIENPSSSSNP